MTTLDPRLNAFRPDLADKRLLDQVESPSFVEPQRMQIIAPVIGVHKMPRFDAVQLTQALMGEVAKVFHTQDGWAWVQLERDRYVGYVNCHALSSAVTAPTHRVAVASTFLYAEPNLKTQPAIIVTLNAEVTVNGGDETFARLSDGRFVFANHLKPAGVVEPEFVAIAEMFLHTPYYWGGKTVHGLDCSGLVQVALEACGVACPRDSDMQEKALGQPVPENDLDALQRGDLVFWRNGHVGIMTDNATLLHANGHHMMAVAEPLKDAVERIARRYGEISSIKRL